MTGAWETIATIIGWLVFASCVASMLAVPFIVAASAERESRWTPDGGGGQPGHDAHRNEQVIAHDSGAPTP